MRFWRACQQTRSKRCVSKHRRPACRSARLAWWRRGRGERALLAWTVSRLSLRARRSAISERQPPAGSSPFWAQKPRRRDGKARAPRTVAIMPRERAKPPMQDTTALVSPAAKDYVPADNPRFVKLHRRFPTVLYLRRHARRHVPRFAFEYMDGGAGADDGIARNWRAFDGVEIVPRYGVTTALPPVGVELFGRRYSAPIGVAPMGGPSIVWPGADGYLAAAAQRARVPYVLGLVGGMTVEQAAETAPDVLWFQLYRCSRNDHAIGFDLVRRAQAAGVNVLMLTLDVPVRTTRAREVAAGVTSPF